MSAIRTLIIDDDVAVAGIHHGFLLARGGFDVVAMAHTGQQGIDLAAELGPELVLLDIHLPDMSGRWMSCSGCARAGGPWMSS